MKRPPNSSGGSSNSSTPPFQTRATRRKTYYQPSVYQFTCRGAFHLHNTDAAEKTNKAPPTTRQQRQQLFNDKAVDGLGAALRDSYTCNGLQTRLRHVADFPLSKSKEEAIQWFEGSPGYRDVSSPMTNRNDGNINNNKTNNNSNNRKNLNGSGGLKPSTDQKQQNNNNKKNNENQEQPGNTKKENEEPEETHSSYGTTQVNILTVREVPVLSPDEAQRSLMNDPFGGFGSIAPAGMLNPFGSLFGGFFGAGDGPGSSMDPSSNMPNMMSSGSRSVSSSTRMTRDENGKRVATTITKTTVVDAEGKKRTETETTVRYLDEGGRVETKKVVHVDGGGGSSSSSTTAATPNKKDGRNNNDARKPQQQSAPHHPHHNMPPPYFHSPPGAIIDSSVPPSPPQVCQIATDLRLGLGVTDGTSSDPDNPNAPPVRKGSSGGWRKTEYLFRLGRFIPPFLVVSQYYEDKEEEERRRQQLTKEYNEKRQRQKESRWGKSSERKDKQETSKDDGRSDADDGTTPEMDGTNNFPIPANLPIDTSRTEYFLQRLHTQMEKNAAMMGFMLKQMLKPDFPKKVYHSGERIYENLGPTAERTGKLMKDVWQMWVNNLGNNFGWDQDDGRGGRR